MKDNTEPRMMSPGQAIGLTVAYANGAIAKVPAQIATFLLEDKQRHMFSQPFWDLIGKAGIMMTWKRWLDIALKYPNDLRYLQIPTMPEPGADGLYHLLVTTPGMQIANTLFPRCQDHFPITIRGKAWDEYNERDDLMREGILDLRPLFLSWIAPTHYNNSHYPQGVWVKNKVLEATVPEGTANPRESWERSGFLDLREYLVEVLVHRTRAMVDGQLNVWTPPWHQSKIVCLGSYGDCSPACDKPFHVMVYWEKEDEKWVLVIDCPYDLKWEAGMSVVRTYRLHSIPSYPATLTAI